MNRRIAKKVLLAGSRNARAWQRWHSDLEDPARRLGRWSPVTQQTRAQRKAALTPGPRRLWWLSFATETGFLGACQVWADCYINAIKQAHRLGCNPGGEVKGGPADPALAKLVPEEYIGVLMDKHTCEVFEAHVGEIVAAHLRPRNALPLEPTRTTRQ